MLKEERFDHILTVLRDSGKVGYTPLSADSFCFRRYDQKRYRYPVRPGTACKSKGRGYTAGQKSA